MTREMQDWLAAALDHSGLSKSELARLMTEQLGRSIDRAAVSKASLGGRRIYADEALMIAKLTGYPLPGQQTVPARSVPLLSWISAGTLRIMDKRRELEAVRRMIVSDLPPGEWIALRVEGDSMDRVVTNGAVIFINLADQILLDARFYVFVAENDGTIFRKFRRCPDRMQPYSTNPDYETARFGDGYRVLGRVCRIVCELA